jgi:hypothetical protein
MTPRRVDASSVRGGGAYVLLRPLTVGAARALRQRAPDADAEALARDLLIGHIVGWNWTDAAGAPLPLPADAPAVLDALTAEECAFLGTALVGDPAPAAAALLAALWTGDARRLPPDYADYLACRMYGCTPAELDEQDAARVALHLAFAAAEREVAARRAERTYTP